MEEKASVGSMVTVIGHPFFLPNIQTLYKYTHLPNSVHVD